MKNYTTSDDELNQHISQIKHDLYNKFPSLCFDKEEHMYTLDGNELISTTTFIHEFTSDFNPYFSSAASAQKATKELADTIKTPAYFRERWELIGKEASFLGTRVHHFAEAFPLLESPICDKEEGVVEFFANLDPKYILVANELRLYDREYYRAGTCDAILYNTETKKYVIIDWKTNNKSIFDYMTSKKLKGIFASYCDSKYNQYCIQLSHYRLMLEKVGIEVEDAWVVWLTTDNGKITKKGHSNQVVSALSKGSYHRVYQTKNLVTKLEEYFVENKERIVSEVKSANVIEIPDSVKLNNALPKVKSFRLNLGMKSKFKIDS